MENIKAQLYTIGNDPKNTIFEENKGALTAGKLFLRRERPMESRAIVEETDSGRLTLWLIINQLIPHTCIRYETEAITESKGVDFYIEKRRYSFM